MIKTSAKNSRKTGKTARQPAKKGAKPKNLAKTLIQGMAEKAARRPTGSKSARSSGKVSARSVARPATGSGKSARSPREVIKIMRMPSPATQPAVQAIEIKTHKYEVGQAVFYNAPTFGRAPAAGSFTIVKLLPTDGDEHQYRIKSNGEAFERVAKESQLDQA